MARDEAACSAGSPHACGESEDGLSAAVASPAHWPLRRNQQEVYLEQRLHPDSSLFNIGALVWIEGPLDVVCAERALRHVSAANPGLRAVIVEQDDLPAQSIAPVMPVSTVDFSQAEDPDRAARAYVDEHFKRPMPFGSEHPLAGVQILIIRPELHAIYAKYHHVAFDGWAASLYHQEVIRCYNALKRHEPIADVVQNAWPETLEADRVYFASAQYRRGLEYWQAKLADKPTHLFQTMSRGLVSRRNSVFISRALFSRVVEISTNLGVTPFHFVLAVFAAWLGRTQRSEEVSIGVPMLGRRTAAERKTIGFYATVLPLRVLILPDASARSITQAIQQSLKSDYRHSRFPQGDIRQGDGDGCAAFEVGFSYEEHDYGERFLGCENYVDVLYSGEQTQAIKVYLRKFDARRDARLDVDVNLSYLDEARARAIPGELLRLLTGAVAAPDEALGRLPLLTAAERRRLTVAVNPPPALPTVRTLVAWFEATAARFPHRPAVSDAAGRILLDYQTLDQQANRLAWYLRKLGVGAEHPVGLCLERGAALVVAIVAVLKAGGCYVPLDPRYPTARLALLGADSGVRLLVGTGVPPDALAEAGVRWVALDSAAVDAALAAQPATALGVTITPAQAAYVMYTSGSTGRPKGCIVEHRNVTALLEAAQPCFGFGPQDVWTLFHSYAFDFAVWELWGALLYGGQVVVVPYWVSRTPEAFAAAVRRAGVTVLNQTPVAFRQVMGPLLEQGHGLRLVLLGGEALRPQSLAPWYEHTRHAAQAPPVVNMYGSTETTVHVTQRVITREDVESVAGSVIGGPLAHGRVYVLDAWLEPVPEGVTGEVYVGGAGVSRGYWGQPGQTAQRFVPDPFAAVPGARLYRSGDLARWRPDGTLEYMGRADAQCKVRGFRVEPGEIEAALCTHPQVAEALVMAGAGPGEEARLVAYVVTPEPEPTAEALQQFVAARLPAHLVPQAFVALRAWPLTPHGKVDRAALPRPEGQAGAERTFVGPHTATERQLVAIWEGVLRRSPVGVTDNFFAIGGDSILALMIVAETRRAGWHLELRELYEGSTIELLARRLDAVGAAHSEDASVLCPPFALLGDADRRKLPADAVDAMPLSSLQAGMLFHAQMGGSIFHDVFSYHIAIPWHAEAWPRALERLARLHPALRTSFHWSGFSQPLQIVHEQARIPLVVTDLTHLAADEQDRTIRAWLVEERTRGFDYETTPLFRVQIHRRSNDQLQITGSFQHAILDGWSVASLFTQLIGLYLGKGECKEPPAGVLPAFIRMEREAEAGQDGRDFWRQQLAEAVPALPRDLVASGDEPRQVHRHEVPLARHLAEALHALSERLGVPLKTLLLAAHLQVLAFASGSRHPVTAYTIHVRPEVADAEHALGMFLNTVPLGLPIREESWETFVRRLLRAEHAILAHRYFPLMAIKRLNHGRIPFAAGFNYVHFHAYRSVLGLPEMAVHGVDIFEETDFSFLAQFLRHPSSMHLDLTLIYDVSWFSAARVAAWGRAYIRALEAITADPTRSIASVSLMDQEERWLNVEVKPLPDGKIDQAVLPPAPPAVEGRARVEPRTATERRLVAIWEGVLRRAPLGVTDDFFAAGGDSILATQAIAWVRRELGVDVPLPAIFEQPDIEHIAKIVDALRPTAAPSTQTKIRRAARQAQRITTDATGQVAVEQPYEQR